jgi:hypothetical protein
VNARAQNISAKISFGKRILPLDGRTDDLHENFREGDQQYNEEEKYNHLTHLRILKA